MPDNRQFRNESAHRTTTAVIIKPWAAFLLIQFEAFLAAHGNPPILLMKEDDDRVASGRIGALRASPHELRCRTRVGSALGEDNVKDTQARQYGMAGHCALRPSVESSDDGVVRDPELVKVCNSWLTRQ